MYRISDGTTTLITKAHNVASQAAAGTLDTESYGFSATGAYLLFASTATNLTANTDANGSFDVFLYDVANGTTTLMSKTPTGDAGTGASEFANMNLAETKVVFDSTANDLTADADNNAGASDVYLYDLATDSVSLVSKSATGGTANARSISAEISSFFGRYVLF
ncbi:MAG: hypothetical protein R3A47_03625 [Polyangiales bacterium]